MTDRPEGHPAMYQRWRSLLFLHFPCPPAEVQGRLPPGLTVDTFPDEEGRGAAWLGFVPFRMEGVRPRRLPEHPFYSDFPEANVRTYVHQEGRDPGVWFFSLDAASGLACKVARRFFALPYHEAEMALVEKGDNRHYTSRRLVGEASFDIEATFGEAFPPAEPGTLDFFLIERYLLYAYRGGRLYTGRVHHSPYPLRRVGEVRVAETMLSAAGFLSRPFVHQIASDGVDVNVFPLREAP